VRAPGDSEPITLFNFTDGTNPTPEARESRYGVRERGCDGLLGPGRELRVWSGWAGLHVRRD
jgi:hypothetical protein